MEQLVFGKIPPKQAVKKTNKSRDRPILQGGKKARLFALSTYAIDDDIKKVIQYHESQIRYYCYILHDKDINEDGTLKENHTHIILETYDPYFVETIRKWFKTCIDTKGELATTLGQNVFDRKGICEYLLHINNPDKYQYSENEITNLPDYHFIKQTTPRVDDQPSINIVNDMLAGLDTYQLVQRYGREYIINQGRYKEVIASMIDDRSLPKNLSREELNTIYYKYRR